MTDMDTTRRNPSLAEEVEDAALDILRECGPKYWNLTDGSQVRTAWRGPDGLVALEHGETGHVAEFRLQVRAVQLPAHAGADGSCPDYGSTQDPCPPGCASGKCVALRRPEPGPGGQSPADLMINVLAAARELAQPSMGTIFSGPHHRLQTALDALDSALEAEALELGLEESGHWHPTTWGDTTTVQGGARVRVGGQHEATVERVVVATWVGSGATTLRVKLEGRDQLYTMPPSGPVEVWTPSLPEWAGQAFLALAGAFGEVTPRG